MNLCYLRKAYEGDKISRFSRVYENFWFSSVRKLSFQIDAVHQYTQICVQNKDYN